SQRPCQRCDAGEKRDGDADCGASHRNDCADMRMQDCDVYSLTHCRTESCAGTAPAQLTTESGDRRTCCGQTPLEGNGIHAAAMATAADSPITTSSHIGLETHHQPEPTSGRTNSARCGTADTACANHPSPPMRTMTTLMCHR